MGLLGSGENSPRTDKLMLKWLALSVLSGHIWHPMNSPTHFAAECFVTVQGEHAIIGQS